MISESSPSHDSETLFAEFIKTLMASDNPDLVIADFTERFPQHRDELRELAQLNRELDVERKPVLPPPERLGEFRICRLISFGGMGEIYEAYHERLDRRVALKIIRRGWSSVEARERFVREQQVLAKLHHSNIVPIHTGGEEGSIQYFTMPYINGASLNYVVATVASFNTSSSSSSPSALFQYLASPKGSTFGILRSAVDNKCCEG
jgi:eukaryotic-like serine/threonine-protein kinase